MMSYTLKGVAGKSPMYVMIHAAASGGQMSWPPYRKYDVKSKIHLDLIWNNGALTFLKKPTNKNNNKMSNNAGSFLYWDSLLEYWCSNNSYRIKWEQNISSQTCFLVYVLSVM